MTSAADTVLKLIDGGADDHPAIGAPGRPPMTFAGLKALARRTIATLNTYGIGRNRRVAIVLDNGPEMATAFIAIAAAASTAPLNPGYRLEEFEFYLSDLKAAALVVAKGAPTPAREAA